VLQIKRVKQTEQLISLKLFFVQNSLNTII
jgi:hypothetical protein